MLDKKDDALILAFVKFILDMDKKTGQNFRETERNLKPFGAFIF